jgi:hypothetical protein
MTEKIVMTENATNAKSEALELHELPSVELDAVSGGDGRDNWAQAQATKIFSELLKNC